MKMRYLACIGLLLLAMAVQAQAAPVKKKKVKKVAKTNLKVIEAYTQKTIAGIPGAPPENGYHFVVRWEGASYPETFFWRGDGGWLSCKIQRVRKVTNTTYASGAGLEYTPLPGVGDKVHKGDTLMLSPVTGGRFPIPDEIPATAKNTLFYKTGGSGWLSMPVTNITKKRDLARP